MFLSGHAGAVDRGIKDVNDQHCASAEVVNAVQRFRDAEAGKVRAELGAVDFVQ
ncbi:hypothetical protein D3C81_1732510 [compost metagenome]